MGSKGKAEDQKDRLYAISRILRAGGEHRAHDLAHRLGVSERTIYRDLAKMSAAGVPVSGTPGRGYRSTAALTLPPLNLTVEELEALHLGLSVVQDVADPDLRSAAETLAARLDSALPEAGRLPEGGWSFDVFPFAEGSNMFHLIPALRDAVRRKSKIQAVVRPNAESRVAWPLSVDFWGRLWTCVVWDESAATFAEWRVDDLVRMTVLAETFPDREGQRYEDWLDAQRSE